MRRGGSTTKRGYSSQYTDSPCTNVRGFNNPKVMMLNIRQKAEVGPKAYGVCRTSLTSRRHDTAGDEARDRWTFFIITTDELADIQLKSLHIATLNLVEKASDKSLPFRRSQPPPLKRTHINVTTFSAVIGANVDGRGLVLACP